MIAVFTLTPKAQWHPLKTHFSTLQHTCNTLQRSLYSCPSKLALQGGAVQPYTLPLKHMSTHCSALETHLQHTATSPYTCCKVTLQHTASQASFLKDAAASRRARVHGIYMYRQREIYIDTYRYLDVHIYAYLFTSIYHSFEARRARVRGIYVYRQIYTFLDTYRYVHIYVCLFLYIYIYNSFCIYTYITASRCSFEARCGRVGGDWGSAQ